MDASQTLTPSAEHTPALTFHPIAAYFRPQFARALRWGLTPHPGPVKCIDGHVCSNLLRLEAALTRGHPLLPTDMLTLDGALMSPAVIQGVLLDIVHTVPLLQAEVPWVHSAWEQLRQDRNGKGGNLIVHGLIAPIVPFCKRQRLTGDCALDLSRFVQPAHQAQLVACFRDPDTAPAAAPVPNDTDNWRVVWQAIVAGNTPEVIRLQHQRQWSPRHVRRVQRAATQLGTLVELPLGQRHLLALSTWPAAALERLRTQHELTVNDQRITCDTLALLSVDELTHLAAVLTALTLPSPPQKES